MVFHGFRKRQRRQTDHWQVSVLVHFFNYSGCKNRIPARMRFFFACHLTKNYMYKFARTQLYKMCPDLLNMHFDAIIDSLNWHEADYDKHGWAYTQSEVIRHNERVKSLQKEFEFLASLLPMK